MADPEISIAAPCDFLQAISADVETAIHIGNPGLRAKVVDSFVKEELTRREGLLMQGVRKLRDARAAVNKIKPDEASFDADMKPLPPTYSAGKAKERRAAMDLASKIAKALSGAIDVGDSAAYEALEKSVRSGSTTPHAAPEE